MTNVDEMTGTRKKMNDINEMTRDNITIYVDKCGFILHPIIKRRTMAELIPLIQQSTPMAMDGNSKIFLTDEELSIGAINFVKKDK